MKTMKRLKIALVGRIQVFIQIFLIGSLLILGNQAAAQEKVNIYSARGYWLEQNSETYKNLEMKSGKGISLTESEGIYLKDYEAYLKLYFTRMSEEEQTRYLNYKDQWESALVVGDDEYEGVFEWRPRDRVINGVYGFLYGSSLVAIAGTESAAVIGIPLVTSGLWLLGPAFMTEKYQNISRNTVRLSNTGKLFGLGYGASLGFLIADENSYNGYKTILGLATLGSIALGEVGFQYQKKNNLSAGHISMLRHYGILGGWIGLASAISLDAQSSRIYGGLVLSGGIAGIIAGNKQAYKYDFTSGDVNAISSMSLSMTGLGLAVAIEMIEKMDYTENNSTWPMIIPATTSILGTLLGQRQVRNVNLTKKQGSTISLATAGGGLIGLGLAAMIQSDSPGIYVGLPSGLALLSHQMVLKEYKSENLKGRFVTKLGKKHKMKFSFDVKPENYFVNQNMTDLDDYFKDGEFYSPKSLVNLKLKF